MHNIANMTKSNRPIAEIPVISEAEIFSGNSEEVQSPAALSTVLPLPDGRFRADIHFGGTQVNLGHYNTTELAAAARVSAARMKDVLKL